MFSLTKKLTPRTRRQTHQARPSLELLEDRSVPSANSIMTVSPNFFDGWVDQSSGGTASFVNGPATAPLGSGSLQVAVGSNGANNAELCNNEFAGTRLDALTQLSYSTFVQANNSGQAPYLTLWVDYNNDGSADDLLFFEPTYQSGTNFPSNPQATVALNTWQSWDALDGGWWSLNGTAGATPGTGVKSLADILAAQPNATIVNNGAEGGLCVVAGFGAGDWDNFVGNVDRLTVATTTRTTYNFELNLPSTVYVNDSWSSVALGRDPDGSGPATALGVDAFTNIQDALAAVNDGGTINVEEGTYAGGLDVIKPVTIQFYNTAERGTATITGGTFTNLNNLTATGAIAIEADNVTIRGLTLTGNGTAATSNYGIFISGSNGDAIIANNRISGFAKNGITTEFGGGSSGNLIDDNTISGIGSVGICLQTGGNNTVTCNTVLGAATSTTAASHANLTIDSESGDVVQGNTFRGGAIGVELFESNGAGTLTGLTLALNNITNHTTAGLQANGTTAVVAENNFWGAASGPRIASNPGGTGDRILESTTGLVDYRPWLGMAYSANVRVFTGAHGTLEVNERTGAFSFVSDTGMIVVGTGAHINSNGRIGIHKMDSQHTKIDVSGWADGTVNVSVKKKNVHSSFTLNFDTFVC